MTALAPHRVETLRVVHQQHAPRLSAHLPEIRERHLRPGDAEDVPPVDEAAPDDVAAISSPNIVGIDPDSTGRPYLP